MNPDSVRSLLRGSLGRLVPGWPLGHYSPWEWFGHQATLWGRGPDGDCCGCCLRGSDIHSLLKLEGGSLNDASGPEQAFADPWGVGRAVKAHLVDNERAASTYSYQNEKQQAELELEEASRYQRKPLRASPLGGPPSPSFRPIIDRDFTDAEDSLLTKPPT
ncbi:hypothetical protein RND71_003375 [Anisodus tanguticus]|uniref:Uncharacterized protein n=1 Tax=Anisodus tanguticus TaxID=243964 RepID=A0AAE1VWM3_9SOLA|nr:hypothetical protein RND71_003375 [Anisodus tanguticus]